MDELELLRSLRASGATAPAATLERARGALAQKIAAEARPVTPPPAGEWGRTTPAAPRRLPRRRLLVVAAAAAALVGGIVVADVVSVDGAAPVARASAAEVLEQSALAAVTMSDPVLAPGQYLKVEVDAVFGTYATDADGRQYAWLQSQPATQYIPADRSQEWVWDRSAPSTPVRFFDAESEAYYRAVYGADAADGGVDTSFGIWRAPGGAWMGSRQRILDYGLEEGLAALPRDPAALLAEIRAYNGDKGQSRDGEVLETVTSILSTSAVPADLRAALYRTLALVPDITVVDGEATLDGRTGVAIGRVETSGGQQLRTDLIIDPGTGQVIGRRDVTLVDQNRVPAGTTIAWSAITTTVVDSAP
jgi:RNA polymerase sigma-70 factor (ECF subfamily)